MYVERLEQSDFVEFLYSLTGKEDILPEFFDYSKIYKFTKEDGRVTFYTKHAKHVFSDFGYVRQFVKQNETARINDSKRWQNFMHTKFGHYYLLSLDARRKALVSQMLDRCVEIFD